MSRVSVIVPCYNYGRYLRECVESVLDQREVNVEVLVIDDASSDDTLEQARSLAVGDPRVEVRTHETNQGHVATFNEGLEWAKGDYVLLISADDALTPGALLRATGVMDAHPEVGFVYGPVIRFKTERPPPPPPPGEGSRWEVMPGHKWLEARCRDGDNCVYSPAVVVRGPLQRELGGYLKNLPRSNDFEMWLRFAVHADVGRVHDMQALSRAHGHNMDATMFPSPIVKLEQTRDAYEAIFGTYAEKIPDVDRLRSLANRALARHALWWIFRGLSKRQLRATPVAALIDFAATTYLGAPPIGEYSSTRAKLRVLARLPRLLPPLWDGLLRWPVVWLRVQLRRPEAAIP